MYPYRRDMGFLYLARKIQYFDVVVHTVLDLNGFLEHKSRVLSSFQLGKGFA